MDARIYTPKPGFLPAIPFRRSIPARGTDNAPNRTFYARMLRRQYRDARADGFNRADARWISRDIACCALAAWNARV